MLRTKKTVRIYGMSPNLSKTPPPLDGEEVWCSNWHRGYLIRLRRALDEWTRYFNMHSKRHMLATYPRGYEYYQGSVRPPDKRVILQEKQKDMPGCEAFPRQEIQDHFAINGKPMRYFTCSVCWFIALAIWEKETGIIPWERIELWGFMVSKKKPKYAFERPCIAYWILEAEKRGIEVWTPPEMERPSPGEMGDPATYDGTLYGYETT